MPLEIKLYQEPNEPPDFVDLVSACYKEKPDKKKTAELRRVLESRPELYRRVFDLAELVRADLVQKITHASAAELGALANLTSMKQELGYDQSPTIERLLIDNILNCWLRYQWTEYQMAEQIGQEATFEKSHFWEKRMTETQKRYLRAVEMLAKVRKMNLPTIQVNINTDQGQQINVAGDLVKR